MKDKGFTVVENEICRLPQNKIKMEEGKAITLLKLMAELENHDDVQRLATNGEIDDEVMEKFANSL